MDIKLIQNISPQDPNYLAQEQEFFTVVINDVNKRDPLYLELVTFFQDKSAKETMVYKDTYFKWYVFLNWKNFQSLTFPQVLQACTYQIPVAFSLCIDVLEKVMWYLALRPADVFETENWYSQIKQAIFQSGVVLGTFQGKEILLRDIIAEIEKMNQSETDSLYRAELNVKIKTLLFSKNEFSNKYIITEFTPDDCVVAFNSLIGFFIGINKDRLLYILDGLTNPLQYEDENPQEEVLSSDTLPPLIQPAVSEMPIPQIQPVEEEIIPEPNGEIGEEPPLTLNEIKSNIDTQFEKDETGQYKDIEGVFELLEQLAEEYSDPEIAQLLYFDETSGGFVWKE